MAFHIIAGLDGSAQSETVLPTVAALAKPMQATVTLVHVTESAGTADEKQRHPKLQQVEAASVARAEKYLQSVQARETAAGLNVETAAIVGDPGAALANHAKTHSADLIAVATHGRSGIARWMYGSVAEKVLALATVPVLLVRSTTDMPVPLQNVANVLVPLDGSELSAAALPLAQTLAKALGAAITVIEAAYVSPTLYSAQDPMYGPGIDLSQMLDDVEALARGDVDGALATLKAAGVNASGTVTVGQPPADAIIEQAHKLPNCVVIMGTHGRSGVAGTLLGSVARQVLRSDLVTITVPPGAA